MKVVCLLCYSNYGEVSIITKQRLSASVAKII